MNKLLLFLSFLWTFYGVQAQLQPVNKTISFDNNLYNRSAPLNRSVSPCSVDTVEYTIAKATGLQALSINNATSGQAIAQYFNAPQDITVHGATFFAWKPDTTAGITLDLNVELYLAGVDSMPTGLPLASAIVTVDTTFGTGSLTEIEENFTFPTPVTVNQPYVIVIGNYSPTPLNIVFNSYASGDGAQEWLSSIDFSGTWTRSSDVSVGGSFLDADVLIYPHVSYDLEADFIVSDTVFSSNPQTITFTDDSSPILQDRMYNQAAYLSVTNLSYTYDFGDGSAAVNAIDTNHIFVATQNYMVTLNDTIFGWRTNCGLQETQEIVMPPIPDLVISEIMYNSPESGADTLEFIEIYNNDTYAVDLINYSFSQGVTYTFPSYSLNPGEYYVVAISSSSFNYVYGFMPNGEFTGGLSNGGEDIVLINAFGETVDSVDYDDASPWPLGEPDGGGASLILCDVNSDNNDGANWKASSNSTSVIINSFEVLASPGAANNCCSNLTGSVTTTICNEDSVIVNGTAYNAANPTGTEVFTGIGIYSCDSTVTINLTVLPALTGSVTTTICNNDSVVVNGTTYNAANPTGTEVFTGVGVNGCDSTVTVNLNVLPAIVGSVSTTICNDDSVVINGTTYNASNPSGTEEFSGIGANGCDSIVTVSLNVLPVKVGSVTTTICDEDSVVVNGTTYNASNLTGTEIFTGIGANGCDSTVTVNLNVETIDITIDNSGMSTLTANQAGASYQWIDCDNGDTEIVGATDQTFIATENGNYAVKITVGACTETSACESVTGVGIKDAGILTGLSVYPNPTNDLLNISITEDILGAKITLTTVDGKIIYKDNHVNTTNFNIDLSNNSIGLYILKVETEKQFQVIKVIKK